MEHNTTHTPKVTHSSDCRRAEAIRIEAIRTHDCAAHGCMPVCVFGDW